MKWYYNSNLKTKIVFFMTLIIIIYSITFSIITIHNSQIKINSQIESSHIETSTQFNKYIDILQSNLVDLSSMPYSNRTFLNTFAGRPTTNALTSDNYLHDFLFSMILFRKDINFVGIVNDSNFKTGYYLSTDGSFGLHSYDNLQNSKIFKDYHSISGTKDYASYLLPEKDDSIITNNPSSKILFIRSIRDPQDHFNLLGYFLLGINTRNFDSLCASFVNPETSGIKIIDSDGNSLYEYGLSSNIPNQNNQSESSSAYYETIDNNKYLVYSDSSNSFGWSILHYTNLSSLPKQPIFNSIIPIVLIILTAAAVFCIMALLVASSVTSPLKQLLSSIQSFQDGDFNQYVPIKYNDELGHLTQGYNKMVTRIKDLVEQNYSIKLKEKEAELNALQAQINPHFLYNTLDLLYWKAIAHEQGEIAQIVYSLTQLFRISLNKGNSWIMIRKETEFLEHYLSLLKLLMSDILQYHINVPTSIENCYIPRFILQPLLENSITHGLGSNIVNPQVCLDFIDLGTQICIIIKDNGCGMSQEVIDKVFSLNSDSEVLETSGYAIVNILSRLRIYFSENSSVGVVSQINVGTKITLTIPKIDYIKEEFHV